MKIIAVNMSSECIKVPRCKFCFKENIIEYDKYDIWMSIDKTIEKWDDKKITVCFEYSGYNLACVSNWRFKKNNSIQTMTTMPQTISKQLIAYLRHNTKINAIALSYNSEVAPDPKIWIDTANLLKTNKFKVSCNFLLEKFPITIPQEIINASDQLNLLSIKPTGKLTEKQLSEVDLTIENLKSQILIATDNCLGIQLGYIKECKRGKDFIHMLPNGDIVDCCFQEKCFLYKKEK